MSTDPTKTESSLEEQLVAYLDGELDAEAARRIEDRLATEPETREALNRLERTWDMLDELGSTPVGDSFTRTTLEMVALAAQEDVDHARAEAPVRRRRRLGLIMAGILAAAAIGFFAVYMAIPNPTRELLKDLPVLENLEEYRQIGDFDFLRLLRYEKTAFPLPASAETPTKDILPPENASPAESIRWVENLSNDRKADLSRKKTLFDNLSPAERQNLRDLHEKILGDEHSAELLRIMHDYYEWWFNLPSFERNELNAQVSPQERIVRIEELKQRNPAQILSERDIAAIQDWMKDYLLNFEGRYQEYLKTLSPEKLKAWKNKKPEDQRRDVVRFFRSQWMRGGLSSPPPDKIDDLRKNLSPEALAVLDAKPREQWRTIQSWLQSLARKKIDGRMARGPGSLVDENEIADYFEKLSESEKELLLNLSPEEMQHKLQADYFSQKKQMAPFFGRPDGPFPGGPPGGPRKGSDREPPKKPPE